MYVAENVQRAMGGRNFCTDDDTVAYTRWWFFIIGKDENKTICMLLGKMRMRTSQGDTKTIFGIRKWE